MALTSLTINFLCLWPADTVQAQDIAKTGISEIISSADAYTEHLAVEKLYLHTDKPDYTAGDTLWFKAYLFDASYFTPSAKSGVLYAEIANDSNRVIKRIMLPVYQGLAFGQIALDPDEMPGGGYVLRAYTNWMRNFGEDYIFKKHFYINQATDQDWLIRYNSRLSKEHGKDKVLLRLRLNQLDQVPVGLRQLQMQVSDGKRKWYKSEAQTSIDGLLDVSFNLPENADPKNLTLNLLDMRKGEGNRKLQVPVPLNRPEYMDLQFMPEGGGLIAGLPARIAFKAVNEDGTGAAVSGEVYNSKSEKVAEFRSAHKGMGSFNLLPLSGESYSARIPLPGGSYKAYPLPAVKSTGITLHVNNPFESDSCEVTISATKDIAAAGGTYFLVGQSRGVSCYGASFLLKKGIVKLRIGKTIFPEGIARFTLLGPDKKALNERIVFIDHDDKLRISINSNKALYRQRDSVALDIKVTDKNGMPVQGSFSLAVTDDGQVKTDSISDGSVVTQMLLTSDLKGYVEDPGYYLQSINAEKWRDLDHLLLTQGWVAYDWDEVFKPVRAFTYTAEQEFLVKGRVTNILNKPVAGSGVTLLSKKPLLVMDTITNAQGIFTFKGIFPADTAAFFIQSRNKRGKSFNTGIEMDEFIPPVFTADRLRIAPWYVNPDTGRLSPLKKQVHLKNEQEKITGGKMLETVVVRAKKIVKDSKNLNGPGEADIILDEKDLEKAGKTTLGDLLYKSIPGFGYRANKSGQLFYRINDLMVHLIIDGMDTEFFRTEGTSLYEYFKQYFDYYDAEEIKGIEVMTSTRYESRYRTEFLDPMAKPWEHAFIEVTTRGGKGPFVKKSVGTFLYKPMPFTAPKKFYSPAYTPDSAADMTDIRSTIYWKPDIVTDKEGKARVSFYTADNAGNYSLIMEGSDMEGNVGVTRTSIAVKSSN